MNSFILVIILWSLIECLVLKINVYEVFIEGVKEGISYLFSIFPALMFLTLWVMLFQSCGIISIFISIFNKVLVFFKIPIDIFIMALTRPISGQGALVLLKGIYDKYGVDHVYSILGSIIQTGSDTTLYVVSLYFSGIKEKSSQGILVLGFVLDFIGFILAIGFYFFGMI